MDDRDFKKHLADLVHGHHHPEEHDWSPDTGKRQTTGRGAAADKRARTAVRKTKRRAQ